MQFKSFSTVFRNSITEKGMTIKAVAERAHIALPSLSAMLNGRQKITATVFINLCRVLNLTPDNFIINEKGRV